MKCYYDLHIHTALSPCADDDMTLNNIAGMAKLNGLDIIAITDHNTVRNVRAGIITGRKHGLLVIPGMELTTVEEIHVLCLFYNIEDAESFSQYVDKRRMRIKLKPEIFGNQYVLNEKDEIIDTEEDLLYLPADISINDICGLIKKYSGIAIPAHIDKEANGVYSILGGFFPWEFAAVEIARDKEKFLLKHPELNAYRVISNSDSHSLQRINERENYIEIEEKTIKCFLDTIAKFTDK